MKQETIERLRKREAMHWGHRAVEAECTETISLADFRDILAVLEAAYKYAEAWAHWESGSDDAESAAHAALLALIDLGSTE